jgi:hypothetical protein
LAGSGRRPRHDDLGSMRGTHGFSPWAKGGSVVAVDWAATVSTGGWCSLLRMTDKRRGDERGKGYGAVECREGVGAFYRARKGGEWTGDDGRWRELKPSVIRR